MQRVIHIGTGGYGLSWCKKFLPANTSDGTIRVVAAIDINPDALANARDFLGLPDSACFTDLRKALNTTPADFATIVVPPDAHEAVASMCLEHGLHVLMEKPIADTFSGALRLRRTAAVEGRKLGITMSHRFDQDKTTLREAVSSGQFGKLDYIVFRFTSDYRSLGSWGTFRHKMAHPLLIEGAIHHFDILTAIAGSCLDTIYVQSWTPPWGQFTGDAQAIAILRFENGVRAQYEAAKCNATSLNEWKQDYIRAECEFATVELNRRSIKVYPYRGAASQDVAPTPYVLPLLERPKWSNAWLIEQFARWVDGGEPMETNIESNLRSLAAVFAGIESSITGVPVRMERFLMTEGYNLWSSRED